MIFLENRCEKIQNKAIKKEINAFEGMCDEYASKSTRPKRKVISHFHDLVADRIIRRRKMSARQAIPLFTLFCHLQPRRCQSDNKRGKDNSNFLKARLTSQPRRNNFCLFFIFPLYVSFLLSRPLQGNPKWAAFAIYLQINLFCQNLT